MLVIPLSAGSVGPPQLFTCCPWPQAYGDVFLVLRWANELLIGISYDLPILLTIVFWITQRFTMCWLTFMYNTRQIVPQPCVSMAA